MKRTVLLIIFSVFFLPFLHAQTGIIEGRVFNSKNNEPTPFANIQVMGTTTGATSALMGNLSSKMLFPATTGL